jgi:hypothetical protein
MGRNGEEIRADRTELQVGCFTRYCSSDRMEECKMTGHVARMGEKRMHTELWQGDL